MSALKNPVRHDDLLNYRLKRLVGLGGAPAIRLCEGGFGVARQEWRVLAALVEDGPMTVGELVARTQMEAAPVSRRVKELARKGLVERAASGRHGQVLPSERGRMLYRDLLPRLCAVNRRIMEVLSEDEALLLEDFLQRLTRQARAIHDAGGGVEVKTGRHLGSSRRAPSLWKHEPTPRLPQAWP
jgi:DNA-binding MarR family transcriptional regulator